MAQTNRTKGKRAAAPVAEEAPPAASERAVCSVAFCPIGLALTGVQGAGTEVLEHLLAATREFLLAAKAIVDARAGDVQPGAGATGLERIEIA